jgi:aldehyde:ferredoxin oxidoreductase
VTETAAASLPPPFPILERLMAERFGYNGRLLRVDLTSQSIAVEDRDDTWWRMYCGGGLLASELLLRETPPDIDAFDSENLLVVASSVTAGQPYAGLARFTVAAKSPLTQGIGEARSEGPFALALKRSGADAIVILGRATEPVILAIDDSNVSIEPAGALWAQTTGSATKALWDRFGLDAHVAAIGPAGENLVRFASIVSDRNHQAARMGMGAVAGSKLLKAIVIRGGALPPVADPDRCVALTRNYAEQMTVNDLTRWQLEPPGFAAWVHLMTGDTAICAENYRTSRFDAAGAYDPEHFMRRYAGAASCPGCPNDCIKRFGAGDDARFDPQSGGIHQEITGALGPNVGLTELDSLLAANIRCNELGMDPDSLGFTISMAMECRERGLLGPELATQIPAFGDGPGLLRLVDAIGNRAGAGDLLAEGSKRAAARIGNGAEAFAMQVKGLELVPFEPRTQTGLALGYATAPTGPRFDIAEHDWDFDDAGWSHALENARTLGILQRIPMQEISARKVRNFKVLQTLWSAADALGFCIFAIAPVRVLSFEQMASMLAAVTGWNTSTYEIMRIGERRLQLMHLYNLREGIGPEADTLPTRFFGDAIDDGVWTGHRIDRLAFERAIRTWYRMMGWDDHARPLYETLVAHHLEWTIDDGFLSTDHLANSGATP